MITVCESNAVGPEWGESWYVLVEDVVCMVNRIHIFCGGYIDELERHRESREGGKKYYAFWDAKILESCR